MTTAEAAREALWQTNIAGNLIHASTLQQSNPDIIIQETKSWQPMTSIPGQPDWARNTTWRA